MKEGKIIPRCGWTREQDHFERGEKLYGINPFAHCESDCPYHDGTCIDHCSNLQITQKPCLKENYKDNKRNNGKD